MLTEENFIKAMGDDKYPLPTNVFHPSDWELVRYEELLNMDHEYVLVVDHHADWPPEMHIVNVQLGVLEDKKKRRWDINSIHEMYVEHGFADRISCYKYIGETDQDVNIEFDESTLQDLLF